MKPLIEAFRKKDPRPKNTPSVNLKGMMGPSEVKEKSSTFYKNLEAQKLAKWTGKGWTLFSRKEVFPIKEQKKEAVLGNTGNASTAANIVTTVLPELNQMLTAEGFQQMGAIQMRKNIPVFLGRWIDSRNMVRELPKARRNMFNLSTKEGKLKYDKWVMANMWNRFAGAYGQYMKDSEKTSEQVSNAYEAQRRKLLPENAKVRSMLNYYKYTYYKLKEQVYNANQALNEKAKEAAWNLNWAGFNAAVTQLAKEMSQNINPATPGATKIYMMAESLLSLESRMIQNYAIKNMQGTSGVAEKLAAKTAGENTARSNLARPVGEAPYLRPSGFFFTKGHLQRALQAIGNDKYIGVKKFHEYGEKRLGGQSSTRQEREPFFQEGGMGSNSQAVKVEDEEGMGDEDGGGGGGGGDGMGDSGGNNVPVSVPNIQVPIWKSKFISTNFYPDGKGGAIGWTNQVTNKWQNLNLNQKIEVASAVAAATSFLDINNAAKSMGITGNIGDNFAQGFYNFIKNEIQTGNL